MILPRPSGEGVIKMTDNRSVATRWVVMSVMRAVGEGAVEESDMRSIAKR